MCQRAAVSIPARVSVAGGRRFPKWDCINGRQRKSPRRAGPWLARPVLPSRFTGPLGHKAAIAACSHELDLQRETHRWRKADSNRRSPCERVGLSGRNVDVAVQSASPLDASTFKVVDAAAGAEPCVSAASSLVLSISAACWHWPSCPGPCRVLCPGLMQSMWTRQPNWPWSRRE